ncbi:MAG: flavodoxin [Clostridia bacterium]|nr:flavodoxin [Clostridia bacterium]
MTKILFINACIRGNTVSRTYKLAQHFVSEYKKHHKESLITQLNLKEMNLTPLSNDLLNEREELLSKQELDNPVFHLAKQFAEADRIIIAAPFWDLNFPALLKIYLENIFIPGITFDYTETGIIGLCKAEKLLFITTRGGFYSFEETRELELGSKFMQAMCVMFGINEYHCLDAEGLDIVGENVEEIMSQAFHRAESLALNF